MALHLNSHAQAVLEKRLLRRDANGQLTEDAEGLFGRVARAIAAADDAYPDSQRSKTEAVFLDLLTSLRFLPNSPTLMNAGVPGGQLAGCFVLPILDSMDSIYGTLRDTALIQKSGGGTGFSFSRLRPKGDTIHSTRGVSSGPVSFMRLYDYSTQVNRLGGKRAGANMGVLRHDHPDILEFINAKRGTDGLSSFNISVMATDAFMHAVDRDDAIALRFPADASDTRQRLSARMLFDTIVDGAWETGDPGLLFFDAINAANPTPALGAIEATNPCGEQPLLDHESCNLGSIDISRFVRGSSIDYDELRNVVSTAVHFLDNVLDVNAYPVEAVRRVTLGNRKIGLGLMGFADLLIRLDVPYASERAVSLAGEVMSFVHQQAVQASEMLAIRRGSFPAFAKSRFPASGVTERRNACVTTIAPTGTISLIAGCSSGIEPLFALSYQREVIGHVREIDVHPLALAKLEALPGNAAELAHVRATGRLTPGAAPAMRQLFATAHEIAPEWHLRVQAAFQQYTDTGVSKTINLPRAATRADIGSAYRLAFELGCKGVTVFRDGCKDNQVLRAGVAPGQCPECGSALVTEAACRNCPACGFSVCMI